MAKRMLIMLAVVVPLIGVIGGVKYFQIRTAMAAGSSFQQPSEAVTTVVATQEPWESTLAAIGTVVGAATGAGVIPGAGIIPGQAQAAAQPPVSQAPYEYTRKGTSWESFSCGCGNLLQLSPAFQGSAITCKLCGKTTVIKQ